MIRRIASALLPFVLVLSAACEKQPADPVIAAADHAAHVSCALANVNDFKPTCTIEKIVSSDGLALVMHHPDGGFRRLIVTTDGRGVIAADGAQDARVSIVDPATIEVAVDTDRYRLPATVKGQPLPVR